MRSKSKKKSAISLIVLVVTILILGILAAVVVISLSSGGIIGQVQNAVDKNNEAVNKEKSLFEKIEDLLNGNTGEDSEIAALIGTVVTENTEVTDEYGNKIVVPEGFKIVAHDNDTVKYTYSDSENNIPTVQDGIVIEDATGGANNGTRFVWVPVGEIKNKDNTTTTISLENATTEASTFSIDESTVIQKTAYEYSIFNGADIKFKRVSDYTKRLQDIETSIIELENDLALKETRISALEQTEYERDLDTFLTTTKENGGYYISQNQIETKDVIEYQPDASKVAKEMYGEVKDKDSNLIYASDLINEYALCAAHIFFDSYSNSENDTKCNISQIQGFIIDHSYTQSTQAASGITNIEKMAYEYSAFNNSEVKFEKLASLNGDLVAKASDLHTRISNYPTNCQNLDNDLCILEIWYDEIDSKLSGERYIEKVSDKTHQRFGDKENFKLVADFGTILDDLEVKVENAVYEVEPLQLEKRLDALKAWCLEKSQSGVRPILYVK